MHTTETYFGTHKEHDVQLYTLENDKGMQVKISNYGATITSIIVPQQNGDPQEIACGFDTLKNYFSEDYNNNSPYFGGTIGRYCSQIKDASFTLNGKNYPLAANCGANNLHGGTLGFDKRLWLAQPIVKELAQVEMALRSTHLEEGFPGNVTVSVTFSLNNDNELQIKYKAVTDADTPFTITNHSYFNLAGFTTSIENHTVQIQANKKQVWDNSGAATGENISVIGADDDLRNEKVIGEVHQRMGDGFEHFYLFEEKEFALKNIAKIKDPLSGRSLEIATTEPGMLFYTGKYTSNLLQRESGQQYGKYRAFCCETHRYPNGPNLPNAPKSILKKGETYNSSTIFKFKW